MLRSLTRIPLRRCLHTAPQRSPPPNQGSNFSLIFGIGAVVAGMMYMSNSGGQRIALDAQPVSAHKLASVPPTDKPVDISSSTPLHRPEPAENPTVPSESDEVSHSEGSEPSEDASSLEHDAGSEGAFNPETGEINWDCPCLGGMAHGPCGPQFREAFSCFVFSEKEPKGIDCVEKFKGMQDCFKEHPDVYGEEIMDDDEGEDDEAVALDAAGAPSEVPEGTNPPAKSQRDASPQTQS